MKKKSGMAERDKKYKRKKLYLPQKASKLTKLVLLLYSLIVEKCFRTKKLSIRTNVTDLGMKFEPFFIMDFTNLVLESPKMPKVQLK